MIHTIQADFYRLFRSKGFWITEFILFVLMLLGATIGATGHLMSVQTAPPETPTHGWDGVQALINTSSNGSNLVFLCIVLACLVLGVDLIGKLIAFIPSTLLNGLGTMPDGFITNLLLTISLQFLCLLAWLSIVSFILYVTHSYLATFIGYLVTSIILSTPMLIFPNIEILRYLNLNFAYAMTADSQTVLYTITVCIAIILFFSLSGLTVFKKKSL